MLDIKKLLAKLIEASSLDYNHPIGSAYSTTDASFDPNTVWGGTWEKLPEGYVLMSGSASGSYPVGRDTSKTSKFKEYGSNTHTLTANEMPSHSHPTATDYNFVVVQKNTNLWMTGKRAYTASNTSGVSYMVTDDGSRYVNEYQNTSAVGGGQAHNIMQKSIAVYWWIRTA